MRAGVLLVVLLLAACAGAPTATPGVSPTAGGSSPVTPAATPVGTAPVTSPVGPGPTGGDPVVDGWRELASGMWLEDEVFAVASAADDAQLETLWARLGQSGPVPAVDFEREMVIFLGMSGSSSCPERLERLVVDHGAATVHGRWAPHDPSQPCTDDLQSQALLLAVERSLLPSGPFLLSLRDQPICPDCPSRPDQVLVDPDA